MTVGDDIEGIRDALVRVVAEWTQRDLQVEIAEKIGGSLEATEVRALYAVGMHGGRLGFGLLAESGALSRPTASKLVSRMSAQGLFDRVRSGRTVEVRLTDAGAEAYARLVAAGQQMVGGALAAWTSHEIAEFQTQLTRFVTALPEAALTSASRPPSDSISTSQEESS